MKKGRFLWSAHRITEKQKAGKARNIKEKRQLKNFNTVSKQREERRSSVRDKQIFTDTRIWTPQVYSAEFSSLLTFKTIWVIMYFRRM